MLQELGTSLKKTYQISDWMSRPLSANQIIHAATHVHCLLQVYLAMEEKFKNSSLRAGNQKFIDFYKMRYVTRTRKRYRKILKRKKVIRKMLRKIGLVKSVKPINYFSTVWIFTRLFSKMRKIY